MQDWLRRTIFHGCSHRLLLRLNLLYFCFKPHGFFFFLNRESAGQFLLFLIRGVYHYTGTLCDVERPLLAIFSEVLVNRIEEFRARKMYENKREMTVNEVESCILPMRTMIGFFTYNF